MATTYEPIATTTLSSSQATITFSSISGAYTDLVLVFAAKISSNADVYIRANSDSGSNYSYTVLSGNGSAAVSARDFNQTNGFLTDYYGLPTTDNSHICICHFNNYSNTTTYKTMLSRANRASGGTDANVALWRSTNAITSLTLRMGGAQTFESGTTATLYGIKAA